MFVSALILFFLAKPSLLNGLSFSTTIYDANHKLLRLTLSSDEKYRVYTPISAISPQLIEATLLQEDQYFFKHYGVNPIALAKAFWTTYVKHSRRVGASTITMQVARLRYGLNSKTFTGKLIQIYRAIQLEFYYSKEQILEAYFNLAPYGFNIEGVGAASLIYFDTSALNLTLAEVLSLTIIPQNPVKKTIKNPEFAKIREQLFRRWLLLHPEDKTQENIMNLPIKMNAIGDISFIAPHFVNTVLANLDPANKSRDLVDFSPTCRGRRSAASRQDSENRQDVDCQGNNEIITTLDYPLQNILTKITRLYVKRKQGLGINNAAVLVIDARTMEIKAEIGSIDFFNRDIQGQINGTKILRSPGSTLKPFIYGLALDQGLIHPNTVLKDVPRSFGTYNPENFDYDFMGPIKAKDALRLSRNIPAIALAENLSHPNLYEFLVKAKIYHLKPESYYGLALPLGGAELSMQEMISLYAILVNGGIWHPLRTQKNTTEQPDIRLLSAEASFLVLDMLKDEHKNNISWKTGTSSKFRDAWTIGNVESYVIAIWLGNFNNQSNHALVGKEVAAPLFFEIAEVISRLDLGPTNFDQNPESALNLKKIPVCKASGQLPTRYCKDTELTWFIPGVSPIKKDTIYREIAINKKTGLRTCNINADTSFIIAEFWPTDLLKVFKQAGIMLKTPPPFEPGCYLTSDRGLSPQITSPQSAYHYVQNAKTDAATAIPFSVITDADVNKVYWFLNDKYLGKSSPTKPFIWSAKPGVYVVRVVDDHGRSDAKDLIVEVNG